MGKASGCKQTGDSIYQVVPVEFILTVTCSEKE